MIEQNREGEGQRHTLPEGIRPEFPSMEQHWTTITDAGRAALGDIVAGLRDYTHGQVHLDGRRPHDTLTHLVGTLEEQYRAALDLSLTLSFKALEGKRTFVGRSRWNNPDM